MRPSQLWVPGDPAARTPSSPLPEATSPLAPSNARLAAARRLTRRRTRRETGRFLAEGAQAVREALAADAVVEVFATPDAAARHPELVDGASLVSDKDAAALSETSTPQGLVAVCALTQPSLADVLAARPRLLVALVEPNEPGNLGAVIRTADAAGADAVLVDGGADPYGGKAVRASAGSLFHLPVVACAVQDLLAHTGGTGMQALATTGRGEADLFELEADGSLQPPTIWLFGTEAHGLPHSVVEAADRLVRIPIAGRAESLNLAAAAAVCLYASARAHRTTPTTSPGG